MSYWDSSAMVKLCGQEVDSAEFRTLAVEASRAANGSVTWLEVSVAVSGRRSPNRELAGALRRVHEEFKKNRGRGNSYSKAHTAIVTVAVFTLKGRSAIGRGGIT